MAKKPKGRGPGDKLQQTIENQGPQTADARQFKNPNVLQGINPLQMEELHTPSIGSPIGARDVAESSKSSGSHSTKEQERSESCAVEVERSEGKIASPLSKSWSKTVGEISSSEGYDLSMQSKNEESVKVKITMEEIEEECEYWKSAVICYVLGSNPPHKVIEGFIKRIWGKLGIDKVASIGRGVFLVRFHSCESRAKVVEEGVQMFDKKPVVVKPWRQDVDLKKESVKRIPVWARLYGLDIKYWGRGVLQKIAGLIGKPLRADGATSMKERLEYARLLVEIDPSETYPTTVMFENEYGYIIEQDVYYEWKPTFCKRCTNFGHDSEECRRNKENKTDQPPKVADQKPVTEDALASKSDQATLPDKPNEDNQQEAGVKQQEVQKQDEWRLGKSRSGQVNWKARQVVTVGNTFEVLHNEDRRHDLEKNEGSISHPQEGASIL